MLWSLTVEAPTELGAFAIEGVLGEGGSAIVYRAHLPDAPGARLALKVLHPDLQLSPGEVERFIAEAEKLGRVSHPAVVGLHSTGLLPDGRPFVAMPWIPGRTLSVRLKEHGPFPPPTALPLFAELARGVAALHAAGLIHRDIKPDNVMITEPDHRLVLLDLGIARDKEGDPSTTTKAGLSRGTPQYMAPERLFGSRATVQTDVYELALLFYVMLAARPPWDEGDAQARLDPKIPPDMAVKLPADLVRVLDDALALKVDRRPESIELLLLAVEQACRVVTPSEDAKAPEAMFAPTVKVQPVGPTQPSMLAIPPPAPEQPHTPLVIPPAAATSIEPPPTAAPPRSTAWVFGALTLAIAVGGGGFWIAHTIDHTVKTSPSSPSTVDPTPTATATASTPSVPAGPAPSTSAPPAPPSSSATPPLPSSSPTSSPAPTASASARPSATSSAPTPPARSANCAALVALVCSPTSGATPEECTAWSARSAEWQKTLPPAIADETCAATLKAEQSGLPLRKKHPLP